MTGIDTSFVSQQILTYVVNEVVLCPLFVDTTFCLRRNTLGNEEKVDDDKILWFYMMITDLFKILRFYMMITDLFCILSDRRGFADGFKGFFCKYILR